MTGKKTLIALIAAAGLALASAASTAQAGTEKDDNSLGGSKVGPLGQPLGGPSTWGARGFPRAALAYGAYAFVPYHVQRHTHTRVR
jgi:hypothetical protein